MAMEMHQRVPPLPNCPFTPLLPSSTTLASAITFGIEISNLEKLLFSLPDSDIQFDNNRSRILSSSTCGPKIRYRLKRVYNCWRFDTSWLSVLEERDSHGIFRRSLRRYYSFYVPNMVHNGHDPTADEDYAHKATSAVASWDEATWQNDDDSVRNTTTPLLRYCSVTVSPPTPSITHITHYWTLRGAITNFGLGSLGRNDTNTTNGDLSKLVH
ncbi:hypothetical protein F5887DRAFT_1259833 [Amanita rubescens]|nr:hypothetical protein F5887DRAFT_1259833 [Amanita rubescens]